MVGNVGLGSSGISGNSGFGKPGNSGIGRFGNSGFGKVGISGNDGNSSLGISGKSTWRRWRKAATPLQSSIDERVITAIIAKKIRRE